ncbi:Ubiquitin carboxyl-terminal hydrolase 26 [Asimina triloba]
MSGCCGRLLQWLRRKNFDSPCDADSGPTASIQCPHGKLLPEQASGAKRLLVPEDLWYFLFECATAAKPDDPSGCLTFPSDSEACIICSMEMSEVACLEDNLRAAKLKQRQNHEKLSQGKPIALYPGCKYYLLPSSWLSQWRIYVTSSGKNASSSAKPEGLEGAIDSIKCFKHSRLLERPVDLTCKRGGAIVQRASAEAQWARLGHSHRHVQWRGRTWASSTGTNDEGFERIPQPRIDSLFHNVYPEQIWKSQYMI